MSTSWLVDLAWRLASGLGGGGVGVLVGLRLTRRATRGESSRSSTSSYVCDCGHPLTSHHPGTNACHDEVQRQLYDTLNNRAGKRWVLCPCQRYVGLTPPPDVDWATLTLDERSPIPDAEAHNVTPIQKKRKK